MKGWTKLSHANETKRSEGALYVLTSDKLDFKSKTITRDKEGHCIIIKGSIHQKDITIITIYVPNIRAPKYIKQMLTHLKGKIDSNTIIVGT